jgi:hypothetical protein
MCVAATLGWVRWLQSSHIRQIDWKWLAVAWIMLAILYAILYPISQRHIVGVGSDSEDALRVTATQLTHLHYPYYPRTYLGNPISPMPGAVILAIPFYFLGRVSLQNVVWLAAFSLFCTEFFRFRSTALAFLVIFVFGSACTLDEFVVGDDYFTNVCYICVAVFLFLRTYEKDSAGWQHGLCGILLGVTLSSRAIYVVIPPLVLAYILQCQRGSIRAWRSFALPILVAAAVTLPFYLYDPAHFSPLHIRGKLNFLAPREQGMMLVGLPMLAVIVSCTGFFIRLTMSRLFLIAGISTAVIVLPPGLLLPVMSHSSRGSWGLLEYSIPPAIFIGLWALSRFELLPGAEPPGLATSELAQGC